MKYLFSIILLCLSMSPVFSDDHNWQDDIQFHGFASQAFVYTTDNSFFGHSEDGSVDFTELGINTSYQVSSRARVAGQILSRHAGKLDNGSPRVDFALVDFNMMSFDAGRLGAYLGRIKNPIGLYNETRDVAFTRQGVFAPQVIYFDKVRDLIMSSDGVHIYGEYFLSNGTLLMQAGTGYPLPDKNVEYAYMGRNWDGDLEGNDLGVFGRIMYEHDGGRWIYSLTGSRMTIDFDHGAADAIPFPAGPGLSSGDIDVDYSVLSAQYNGEKWQFTTEVAFEHVAYNDIGAAFDSEGFDSIGYYGQLDYKFTPSWQAFIRYEEFQLNIDDWNGGKAERKSIATSDSLAGFGIQQTPTPAHANYAKILVLGTHWDLKDNLRLRAEVHIAEGSATLSQRENDIALTDKYWNMFATSLSYRF